MSDGAEAALGAFSALVLIVAVFAVVLSVAWWAGLILLGLYALALVLRLAR